MVIHLLKNFTKMFSKFKQEKPSHVPEPEMRTGIIPFSLLRHATQKKSPREWEISQLKKEKAMALLEEVCEEANDTLIRRFGGSGLTYVSVYFLNQQLISWLIFLLVKTRWSSFCKGWLERKTGGEAIARLRPLGWSNIGCPEGKASRKTNRTNLASTFFKQIKGI